MSLKEKSTTPQTPIKKKKKGKKEIKSKGKGKEEGTK
jgi:hypothetical protein